MAESITQDTAYRAVMEPKGYSVTLRSGKANGETKTYIVEKNSTFTFPSYPFTPDPDTRLHGYFYTFPSGYRTYWFVGGQTTVTSDMIIDCVLVKPSLDGKQIKIRYTYNGRDSCGYTVLSYDPALEGMYYQCGVMVDRVSDGTNFPILLNAKNLNSYQDISSGLDLGYYLGPYHSFGDGKDFPYGGREDPPIQDNRGTFEASITLIVPN